MNCYSGQIYNLVMRYVNQCSQHWMSLGPSLALSNYKQHSTSNTRGRVLLDFPLLSFREIMCPMEELGPAVD